MYVLVNKELRESISHMSPDPDFKSISGSSSSEDEEEETDTLKSKLIFFQCFNDELKEQLEETKARLEKAESRRLAEAKKNKSQKKDVEKLLKECREKLGIQLERNVDLKKEHTYICRVESLTIDLKKTPISVE